MEGPEAADKKAHPSQGFVGFQPFKKIGRNFWFGFRHPLGNGIHHTHDDAISENKKREKQVQLIQGHSFFSDLFLKSTQDEERFFNYLHETVSPPLVGLLRVW